MVRAAGLRNQNEALAAMREHIFACELWLPQPRPVVFPFFADAFNLQEITPAFVHFAVLTPPPIEMRVGALLDYQLRVHGLPIRWRTKITAWEPPFCFVDEQLRGPYRRWIHEHTFEEQNGGTLVKDKVRYAVWGGRVVDKLFVRRDVENIFAFRQRKLSERFAPANKPH